jgi:hypothetical protein
LPYVSSGHLLSLSLKPIALIFNELFPLCFSALLSELDKIVPKSMSVNSLGSDINTPLQLIQSECTLKPSDEASSHHLAA